MVDASDFARPVPVKKPAPVEARPAPVEPAPTEAESQPEDEGEPEVEEQPERETTRSSGGTRAPGLGPLISSRKNARIHLARALATRRGRKREGKFLIEGPKVIQELLERLSIELVLWKDGAQERPDVRELLGLVRERGIESFGVAPALFAELVDTESSQGVLAVAPVRWGELDLVLGPVPEDVEKAEPRAVVVAAGVQDPGNLGTIMRSARFLGFAGVLCLSGTTDPWAPKVVRASSGALIESPPARVESLAELSALARERGYKTVALVPKDGRPLESGPLPGRSLLLLGAEGPGLPAAAIEGADERVTLRASDPEAESLNAAMAFGIFAYAWRTAWAPR
jgi:TrmH family RNA methyltransferase